MSEPDRSTQLLTPREAATRLLEWATLTAYQTNGAAGLRPVRVEGRLMFRPDEVDALLNARERCFA
jgi:hypothetical protein